MVIDLANSIVLNSFPIQMPAIISGGYGNVGGVSVALHLVVQNTGQSPGCLNVAVTADNPNAQVVPATATAICAGPGAYGVGYFTLGVNVSALHTFTVSTGDASFTFKLSFVPPEVGGGA